MFVVVAGSLTEGVTHIYGPFDSHDAAEDWIAVQPWDDGVDGHTFEVEAADETEYARR